MFSIMKLNNAVLLKYIVDSIATMIFAIGNKQ